MDKTSAKDYIVAMIEKFEDLGLTDEHTTEQVGEILKEKLGVSFADMAAPLSQYLQDKAEELAKNYITVICYGDYLNVIEGEGVITKFFREEASKLENWVPDKIFLSKDPKQPEMIEVAFNNKAVDENDSMFGYVFVSFAGVIRHAFVHGDP
jgi:hypothetical protein